MDSLKSANQLPNNPDHRPQTTDYYLIRYAEIALKGKNRRWFEDRLAQNILHSLPKTQNLKPKIQNLHSQLLLKTNPQLTGQSLITNHLSKTFGIAWFAPVVVSSLDLDQITASSLSLLASNLPPKPDKKPITFAVRVTRHHKSYPLTSRELEIETGSIIAKQFKLKVDLTHPDLTLYIEIFKDQALLYTEKIPGPGGLPVGTAGKALCLLSGGFDSVAAAYSMAKRGLQIDFLHFHVFDKPNQLKQTKVWSIAQFLSPIVHARTLYTVSCSQFQSKLKHLDKKYRSQKLILSRRFMMRTALQLAQQSGYQAIITGDSLGQVASQTLSNLTAVNEVLTQREQYLTGIPEVQSREGSSCNGERLSPQYTRYNNIQDTKQPIPLFRPLIGMDKVDIINLVKQIGLYDEVIKPYQDCCSLAATHPATHANLPLIHKLESSLSLPTFTPEPIPLHIGS